MKPAQKQMALKGALFMILAANVSWQTHKSFHSTELASELGASGSVPGRTLNIQSPLLLTAAASQAAGPQSGPKPDLPISLQTINIKESTETRNFCGIDFKIHFIEQLDGNGKPAVHAYISRVAPRTSFQGFVESGTYKDLIDDSSSKAKWDKAIADHTIAKLDEQGEDCNTQASSPQSRPQTAPQTPAPVDHRDEIARGLRNCSLDAAGNPLRGTPRYECNLKRLEKLSLDTSSDDDEDLDDNGRRPRRQTAKRHALAEVEAALRPLETSIQSMLLSNNDDKRLDGEDRLADVVTALESVRDTASNSNDERAMNKIIEGLQKAYPMGEKVDRKAEVYTAQLSKIDDRIADMKASMIGANVYQQQAIYQQLQMLQTQRLNTLQIVNGDSDYLSLRRDAQLGLLSQSDFANFTADYNQLLQQVTGGNSAYGQGNLALAPNDIMNLRGQSIQSDPRNYGLANPSFPTINYSTLGLNNPSIAGGAVPAFPQQQFAQQQFPSVFPQSTAFPQQQFPQQQYPSVFPQSTAFPQQQFPQQQQAFNATPSIFNSSTVPGRL